ncbi:Mur ligase domain-containing protein, partial [Helicobacter pylori]
MLETPKVLLKNLQDCKIHFIGIGGIGISGLAKYLKAQGAKISGSDIAISPSVKYLKALGVEINIPHDPKAINHQDVIIHSAIIKEDNTEIQRAKELEIPILSRKDALYSILKDKRVFSVCGAHGKSSITAMLSAICPFFGAIIGAHSKEFDSNVRESANDSLVFEADESDSSFLFSNPFCAIVPNTEPEHLEHYDHDLERFFFAYKYFLDHAQKRVIYKEDPFLKNYSKDAITLEKKDIRNIQYILKDGEPYTSFELKDLGAFLVWGLGEHNATNASLAILSALDEL